MWNVDLGQIYSIILNVISHYSLKTFHQNFRLLLITTDTNDSMNIRINVMVFKIHTITELHKEKFDCHIKLIRHENQMVFKERAFLYLGIFVLSSPE